MLTQTQIHKFSPYNYVGNFGNFILNMQQPNLLFLYWEDLWSTSAHHEEGIYKMISKGSNWVTSFD